MDLAHHTFINFATIHQNSRKKDIIVIYIPGSLINAAGRQPVSNEFFPCLSCQTRMEGKRWCINKTKYVSMFPRKHLFHRAKVNLENLTVVLSTILASIDDYLCVWIALFIYILYIHIHIMCIIALLMSYLWSICFMLKIY